MTELDPDVADDVPYSDRVTPYDEQHLSPNQPPAPSTDQFARRTPTGVSPPEPTDSQREAETRSGRSRRVCRSEAPAPLPRNALRRGSSP